MVSGRMAFFVMRFDFRSPDFAGVGMAERYEAALDMASWAEEQGFVSLVLSEHHGSPDGYLPSPLPVAAAMAARTSRIRIRIAAMVAPFHDPLRLAEDVAVVDLLSKGRLDLVLTNGYVPQEFAMFGRSLADRPRLTTWVVETLRKAWTGEPFEHDGRTVRVTPAPYQPGGPAIVLGGSSEPAARRAARIGDDFMPSTPEIWAYYRDEVQRLGRPDPGEYLGGDISSYVVSADPERTWVELAPYALHEMNAYGAWAADAGQAGATGYVEVTDVDELRRTGAYKVVTPDELVDELTAKGPFATGMLHPLMGGTPPRMAWEGLRLLEREVLPRLG